MFLHLSSLATGQMTGMLLGFVAFAYLARTLSPAGYGAVEYAVGLAGLGAVVIEWGVGTIGSLGVARDSLRAPELAPGIVATRLLLAAAVVPAVGLIGSLGGHDGTVASLVWLFAFSLLAIPFKQDWLLQGLERMNAVAFGLALKAAVFALGVFVIVRGSGDALEVGLIEMTAAVALGIYYLTRQRLAAIPLSVRVTRDAFWSLIRRGAPVGGVNIIWAFMLYLPLYLVTRSGGTTEAAWFGAVQRIVVALMSFSFIYHFNLLPAIARGLGEERSGWESLMESSFRLVAWASVGAALVLMLLAQSILVLAYGEQFAVAAPVLAAYVWLIPVRLLSGHSRWTLVAGERQGLYLLSDVFGTAVLIVLCVALVPAYGPTGGAVALVAANLVAWLVAHVFAARHVARQPGVRDALFAALAALASVALGTRFESPSVILAVAVAAYLICMATAAGDLTGDLRRLARAKRAQAY
jgi:O-antigen/teichoic acid export membrane protein